VSPDLPVRKVSRERQVPPVRKVSRGRQVQPVPPGFKEIRERPDHRDCKETLVLPVRKVPSVPPVPKVFKENREKSEPLTALMNPSMIYWKHIPPAIKVMPIMSIRMYMSGTQIQILG
jgi:hypothetical protein